MGNWTVVIQGTGAHHNKEYQNDADKMYDAFLKHLIESGQQINHASFTSGGRYVSSTYEMQSEVHSQATSKYYLGPIKQTGSSEDPKQCNVYSPYMMLQCLFNFEHAMPSSHSWEVGAGDALSVYEKANRVDSVPEK